VKQKQIKHLIKNAYNPRTFQYVVPVRLLHDEKQLDLRLLLDTGAAYNGISQSIFEELGIKNSGNIPVTFGGGPSSSVTGIVDTIVLNGMIRVDNQKVIVLSDAFFRAQPTLSGILGIDFLRHIGLFMGHGFIRIYQDVKD